MGDDIFMTRSGRKRPQQGAGGGLGSVVSDSKGNTEMIEFTEYRANPMAPSILVNKVGGIYKISHNLVKVTFALTSTVSGGLRECVERVSLIWEPGDVMAAQQMFEWAFKEWRNGTFSDYAPDDGGRRTRTQ